METFALCHIYRIIRPFARDGAVLPNRPEKAKIAPLRQAAGECRLIPLVRYPVAGDRRNGLAILALLARLPSVDCCSSKVIRSS